MRIWSSNVYNWKLPVLCDVSEQILFQYMGRMENLPDRQYPGAAGNLPARTQVYETEISELESERESRETFQRTQNTMRQKMSREISKHVSKSWKAF